MRKRPTRNTRTLGVLLVFFFLREINRFLEILSSFCIFQKALFLDPRDSILRTRDLRLDTRALRLKDRVLRFKFLTFLLLSSTVFQRRNHVIIFLHSWLMF